MIYLKCSCLYSSGQNILIDFNAIDTVLLGWGTYECNYRLLNHSTRNCLAHKTVCILTTGAKYILAQWRRNSIVHSSMMMCCEVKQPPLFICHHVLLFFFFFYFSWSQFPFYGHGQGAGAYVTCIWTKAGYTPGGIARSSQGPIWTFGGLVLCSRVPGQCSEGVLVPPYQHTFQLLSWSKNLTLLSPVLYRLSCHCPNDFLKLKKKFPNQTWFCRPRQVI